MTAALSPDSEGPYHSPFLCKAPQQVSGNPRGVNEGGSAFQSFTTRAHASSSEDDDGDEELYRELQPVPDPVAAAAAAVAGSLGGGSLALAPAAAVAAALPTAHSVTVVLRKHAPRGAPTTVELLHTAGAGSLSAAARLMARELECPLADAEGGCVGSVRFRLPAAGSEQQEEARCVRFAAVLGRRLCHLWKEQLENSLDTATEMLQRGESLESVRSSMDCVRSSLDLCAATHYHHA